MSPELREDIEAIRTLGLATFLYLHFIYRHHMRVIHRFGRHQMKRLHPMGGDAFYRCDWCGHSQPTKETGK